MHTKPDIEEDTIMNERTGLVTMKGQPMTLVGNEVKVGDKAPDFEVTANDLSPVRFSFFKGKIRILSSVTSLDTSVCSSETKRFNGEAAHLGPYATIITISMDLPYAQKRWAEKNNITRLHIFSDHRYASFGKAYGVLMKEVRLLARGVFLVDRDDTIKYMEIVKDGSQEPDYEALLNEVEKLTMAAAG